MMLGLRRYITSSVGFCFVVVATTGVVFKLFFKEHTLEEVHGWIGLVLVVMALLHISQNWKSIQMYLRDARVLALLLPLSAAIVAIALSPEEEKHGPNPRQIVHRLAEGSFDDIAKVFGKDAVQVAAAMRADGLRVDKSGATLQQVGELNHRPPENLLNYFLH